MIDFSAVSREMILSPSTTRLSVSTAPLTTASPRPQAAEITSWSRRPLAGLAVNITPADSASTICWTTTAKATEDGSISWRAR